VIELNERVAAVTQRRLRSHRGRQESVDYKYKLMLRKEGNNSSYIVGKCLQVTMVRLAMTSVLFAAATDM
jgi:hypothetical protein